MTKYILDKMDSRRKAKQNTDVYKQLDEEIKTECHAAKERMFTEQCDFIEQLESAHKFHQTLAQIRKVTGRGNNAELRHALMTEMGTSLWNRKIS